MSTPRPGGWRAAWAGWWASWWWLAVLALGAVAVRVAYVAIVLPQYQPVSDAVHYHEIAAAVAEGRGLAHPFPLGFVHPTAFRPPLYPLLLGGVYAVTGPRLGVAMALNVALGSVVVVLAALLAWRLAGRRAGVAAGVLAGVYPPLLANDGPPLSEPLGLALLLATVLFLGAGRTAGAGVTAGLLVLTRPSGQFLAAALAAWVLLRGGWRRASVFSAVVAVVIAPWLVRNWVHFDAPVLVTSNGFNLSAVYSPESKASGGFVDPVFDPRFAPLRAGVTDEAALDAALRRHALASLRRDPLQVLEVAARNSVYLFELDPRSNEAPELLDGRSLRARRLTLPLVYAVTALGVIGLWAVRRRPGAGPLLLAATVLPLATLVSVAAPRLRAPFDVACCVAVGALAAEVWSRWARRRAGPRSPTTVPTAGLEPSARL